MTGRYLTGMADVLEAAGLELVLYDGWETRARSSGGYADGRPWCVLWHHTASRTTPANDVYYMVYGSPDAPVANMLIDREGVVWLTAAGASNHAGKGGPEPLSRGTVPLDSMNLYAVGMEIANDGVGEPYPPAQLEAAFTASIALQQWLGLDKADAVTHAQWAPTRKIDPATAAAARPTFSPGAINASGTWNLGDLRAEIARRWSPQPGEDGLMFKMFQLASTGDTLGGYCDAHGIFAQVTWLNPSRADACLRAGAPNIGTLADSDLANCDLLGPVPPGVDPATFANVIG
jgi:hypothetical protein